jgi:hypothetical protein
MFCKDWASEIDFVFRLTASVEFVISALSVWCLGSVASNANNSIFQLDINMHLF